MTAADLAHSQRGTLATLRRDPRDQWPPHARELFEDLAALYGEHDPLPTLAAGWIARQRSDNTMKSYARSFRVFEQYVRECGMHPMTVKFPLADAFRLYLESAPTWVRVKGGARGEMIQAGPPMSDAARAASLSGASSFYNYLDLVSDDGVKNPFDAVLRPAIDPGYSSTRGLTEQEVGQLLVTARDRHLPAAYRPRTYALLLVLYTACTRIDSALTARAENLGYDRGHHVLDVRVKGGTVRRKPLPAVTFDALQVMLAGRTTGWLFQTSTGGQLDEPAAWRTLRSVARRAGIADPESVHPHVTKVSAITHALDRPDARPDKIQRWADHNDARTTQRYNRRRELLADSPGYGLAGDLASALEQG